MIPAVTDIARAIDYATTEIIPISGKEASLALAICGDSPPMPAAYSGFSLYTSQPSSTASDAGRNTSTFLKY
jgi:hypothetical protein